MQAPGGSDEDQDGGFIHGGWLVPYVDERFIEIMTAWAKDAAGFLLGRKTYEIFAGSWPNSTDPNDEIAVALNTKPKYVASTTLNKLEWANSSLIEGDVVARVRELKAAGGGEIQVHGSAALLQTLLRHELVDTLRLWFFPVVLGAGKRLFGEGTMPASFRLTETEVTPAGAVLHVYERAGDLSYGEMEVGSDPVILDRHTKH